MADVLRALTLLESLQESVESHRLFEVKEAVEDLLISRVSLAVVGDRGPEKAAFLNALRALGPQDEGAAQYPSPTAPEELAVYPDPRHPDFRLWDLPPPLAGATPFDPAGYMERVKLLRYNATIVASGRVVRSDEAAVFREARAQQRETVYLALLACEGESERSLEERRRVSLELLRAEGVAVPKVYLVRPGALETLDFPSLLTDMGGDLPVVRAQALILALPTLTSTLVTQKSEAFKALVWAAASLSGGVSAIPVPLVAAMVDASMAARILTKARASLCLDDGSVERLAQRRGLDPAQLKALRTCSLSVNVTKVEVKKRLAAAAEADLPTGARRLAEMAIPRRAHCFGRSFTAMLQALNGAIEEMAADAERIVAAAIGSGK